MRRGLAALLSAALLLAALPGAVGAARVSKFTDRLVSVNCEEPVDGGYISSYFETSQQFGASGFIDVWLDPAIPYEDPVTATGSASAVDVSESADQVDMNVAWSLTDQDGNPLADGTTVASLTKVGEPYTDPPLPKSNHHSSSVVTHQDLQGSATITILGVEYGIGCGGQITDFDVFESNPTSYVSSSSGVQIECFWGDDDTAAGLYAVNDDFGLFVSPFLDSADGSQFGGEYSGSFDTSSIDVTVQMYDELGNALGAATVTGSFTPVGDPVTSYLISSNRRVKHIEQVLAPDGSIEFPTGQSFALDADHCSAIAFANKGIQTNPEGPKPGSPPPNDTPDGAIALSIGSKLNVQTTGTAIDPEVPITTCPEGEGDDLGHTVWYTFQGTGNDVTIDTSGSDFDTVVAVYTRDGDAWSEVGCEDDLPLVAGSELSYQAILTVPTEDAVTYYVQAGGFRFFFDPSSAQSGRLRLALN